MIALVQRICFGKGLDVSVTHGWWEGFCHQHTSIVLCTPAHLSIARAKATDPEMFSHYLLQSTLCEYDLLDKPSQLFNIDETAVPLNPDLPQGLDCPQRVGLTRNCSRCGLKGIFYGTLLLFTL